ncbi:helix-turn-helix transcriptional regulator [Gaetbulibacter aquiaggeris]|uniref:Helix-turn-helix transcriptional regulator n=1 Tax=Gaetbulibacter aquiaggeris TaxID=1735373 RepID=A0ABW7MNC4_9FLAO
MKRYYSFGELLIDYRKFYKLSQLDLANNIKVDLRTVQRWEKDLTLISSDKEEDFVLETLIPYQLIRNLNAKVPIPTFYDFKIRKYSLDEITNNLPKAKWFKEHINLISKQLRPIDFDYDNKYLRKFIKKAEKDSHILNEGLLKQATVLLPELNNILTSESGFYSGHSIILPLKESTYQKLRNRTIHNKDLNESDLVDFRKFDKPIFYSYDISADCNYTYYYIATAFLRFFKEHHKTDYLFCTYSDRDDGYELNQQAGLNIVWEDKELQKVLSTKYPPRFMEGNYRQFLADLN